MQFEGLDGVFVEGGAEDDLRPPRTERPDDLKAVRSGHLDVEENGVRPQFGDLLDGFFTVAGLAHDDHITIAGQQFPEAGAR